MMLALAWLTVSIPFVYSAQQLSIEKIETTAKHNADSDTDNNPFANTTEEKAPSGSNTLSEYLHDTHTLDKQIASQLKYIYQPDVATYIAYHGELTGPPPKA